MMFAPSLPTGIWYKTTGVHAFHILHRNSKASPKRSNEVSHAIRTWSIASAMKISCLLRTTTNFQQGHSVILHCGCNTHDTIPAYNRLAVESGALNRATLAPNLRAWAWAQETSCTRVAKQVLREAAPDVCLPHTSPFANFFFSFCFYYCFRVVFG